MEWPAVDDVDEAWPVVVVVDLEMDTVEAPFQEAAVAFVE